MTLAPESCRLARRPQLQASARLTVAFASPGPAQVVRGGTTGRFFPTTLSSLSHRSRLAAVSRGTSTASAALVASRQVRCPR